MEDRIRTGKNTGIGHLPSNSFALNQAWCVAATIACDLLCWLRLLCLDGPLAGAEPKTLRYRLLHTAARLVRGQRKRKIKIPETWPWARELEACFLTIFALPRTDLTPRTRPTPDPAAPGPWNRRPPERHRAPRPDPHPNKIRNGGEDHQSHGRNRTCNPRE